MTLISFPNRYLGLIVAAALNVFVFNVSLFSSPQIATAQASKSGAITLKSDIQESNSETGVITARGNVQISYPARQIQATAAQAQYYSRERRLILTGNVYVLQEGNSLRAEEMTYLIDEGKFIAKPQSERQVESTYIITAPEAITNE
ncbi:MAG: LptA/OstA family protein [Cyanobacteria bacterium J06621_12]